VTGRWGKRCGKLLDDLTERRGYSHLKEEALDRTVWRACFGRGFGPVVRQTVKWLNEWTNLEIVCAVHFLQILLLFTNKCTVLCICWFIKEESHMTVLELYTHSSSSKKLCQWVWHLPAG
jgi:hypothetical protein